MIYDTFNDRTDKIVVYFTVYFCGCSFGEIPIVLKLFGSFGLFFPCLIEDLFAHKDFKRALFSKKYKLVDENKIVMRDDFSRCCLHALPLLNAGNKVHQIYKHF